MDKLLPTPEEVAEALGIGRTKVYEPIWIAALIMADGQRVVRRASSRKDAAAKLELLLKARAEGQALPGDRSTGLPQ